MSIAKELGALYRRDLTRLIQQIEAYPNDATLWQTHPAITNSAGNLVLHLEGNLREYIGRQLGNIPYTRKRELEFSSRGISQEELLRRVAELKVTIPSVIERLSPEQFEMEYPEIVLQRATSTHEFVIHLHGHLNWHMGEIDYLRRILTNGKAVNAAGLEPVSN
jgi:hypothetical protein